MASFTLRNKGIKVGFEGFFILKTLEIEVFLKNKIPQKVPDFDESRLSMGRLLRIVAEIPSLYAFSI